MTPMMATPRLFAHLQTGGQHARGPADVLRGHPGQHGRRQRSDHHAHAGALDDQTRQQPSDVAADADLVDRDLEQDQPDDHGRAAEGENLPAEPGGQFRRVQRGDQVTDADRAEDRAGAQRVQPATGLHVQREHEEERRLAHPEHQLRQQSHGERPVAEHRRIDQWRPAPGGELPLVQREDREQHDGQAEADPGPRRPALPASLDQRQQNGDQGRGDEQHARDVELGAPGRLGLGHQAGHQDQRDRGDRQVDQEAGSPVPAEDVGIDQQPADELAEHRGDTHRQAIGGERPQLGLAGERGAQDGQHLRRHQRGGHALHDPRGDQCRPVRRDAAGQRRQREQDHPDGVHAAPAEDVTEPATGDHGHAVGQCEAGDDPLNRRRGRPQVGLHGRDGHVDDEEVEGAQEDAGEDDEQRPDARRDLRRCRRPGGTGGDRLGVRVRSGHGFSAPGWSVVRDDPWMNGDVFLPVGECRLGEELVVAADSSVLVEDEEIEAQALDLAGLRRHEDPAELDEVVVTFGVVRRLELEAAVEIQVVREIDLFRDGVEPFQRIPREHDVLGILGEDLLDEFAADVGVSFVPHRHEAVHQLVSPGHSDLLLRCKVHRHIITLADDSTLIRT
jgi:hypothetical protein